MPRYYAGAIRSGSGDFATPPLLLRRLPFAQAPGLSHVAGYM